MVQSETFLPVPDELHSLDAVEESVILLTVVMIHWRGIDAGYFASCSSSTIGGGPLGSCGSTSRARDAS
jgi:hypothetical protein